MRPFLLITLLTAAFASPVQAAVVEVFARSLGNEQIAFALRTRDTKEAVTLADANLRRELDLPVERETLIEVFHFGNPDSTAPIEMRLIGENSRIELFQSGLGYTESASAAELLYRLTSAELLQDLARALEAMGHEFAHPQLITR